MKRIILRVVSTFCLAGFINSAQAFTVITNAVEDTYVRGGIYAETNFNAAAEVELKYDAGNLQNSREIYYKFDLTALTNLPGVVESATIELYRSNGSVGQPIHAVCETFTNLAWSADSVTWSNPPPMIDSHPSLIDYNPRASEFANDVIPGANGWYGADFTDRLNEYVDAGRTGVTVHIYGGTPNSSPYAYFIALEHGNNSLRPHLTVVCQTYPVGLTAVEPLTGGGVTVSWRAYPQATGYKLEVSDNQDGPWTEQSVGGTSYVDAGIAYGSLRYYRVTAELPAAALSDTSPVVRCSGEDVRGALADTFVDSGVPGNLYGDNVKLNVKNSGTSTYQRESLLRFNVAGLGAAKARLRLYHASTIGDVNNPTPYRSNGLIVLRQVPDTGWEEASVSWNTLLASGFPMPNRPGASLISGEISRFYTAGTTPKWFDLDVSDAVRQSATNGVVMFHLCAAYVADGGSVFTFSSKEESAHPPELILTGRPFGQPGPVSAALNETNATLSWEGLLGAKAYRILRASSASGPYSLVGTTTENQYEDDSLAYGYAAYYRVEPVDVDDNLGPQSEPVEVFPLVTEILSPTADAHVQYNEDQFMGALPTIWVKRYTGYHREGFLQFDLSILPQRVFSNAVLRIVAADQEATVDRSDTQIVIERIAPFAWTETTLNWTLASTYLALPTSTAYVPAYEFARFQAEDAVNGTVYEFDVASQLTAARRAGDVLLLHVYVATINPGNTSKSITFFSKESSVENYRPTLTCAYNPRSFGTLFLLH